ncbi:hypothetical protein MYIN104542_00930 [Mycobacterium intermedium]
MTGTGDRPASDVAYPGAVEDLLPTSGKPNEVVP